MASINKILRGDELPTLLVGQHLLDLRTVGEHCKDQDLHIALYVQNDQKDTGFARYLLGRDHEVERTWKPIYPGYEFHIELCEQKVGTFHENELMYDVNKDFGTGGTSPDATLTRLSCRLYRQMLRPPYEEHFVDTINNSNVGHREYKLSAVLLRYIRYENDHEAFVAAGNLRSAVDDTRLGH
jgi:hypothetical protein